MSDLQISPILTSRGGADAGWCARAVSRRVLGTLTAWRTRARARRQLAQLDGRQLRDIAVSPFEVRREIIKPFWRE